MPLTPSTVKRSTDASGDDIATFDNGSGQKVQAAALVDGSGNHAGITGNPFQIGAASLPLPSGAASEATLAAIQLATRFQGIFPNHIDEFDTSTTYVGKEDKDGVWLLQKSVKSGTVTAVTWATVLNNGSVLTYSAAWTARATLTYGTFAQAF